MSSKQPVWSWTDAVAAARVPSLTKLVCLNIARYLSSAGKGWRISIDEMKADTGMKERALTAHLQNAKRAGLIVIKREYNHLGHRTTTQYIPRFPDGVELSKEPASLSAPDADRPDSLPAPRAAQVSSLSQSFQKAGLAPLEEVQEQLDGDGLIPFGSTDGTAHYVKGSPSFLAACHKLCVDPVPILKRFAEKTKGKKIKRPTAYLVRMAQEEAAERNGLTASDIATVSVASRKDRATAMAAQVGVKAEPAYAEDEFRKRLAAPRSNGSALVAALGGADYVRRGIIKG